MLKQYFEPGSLFANRSYRNLWVSTVLTIVAMTAFPIALAISVIDAGGSATVLGLILGVRILAGVLFAPVGGVCRSLTSPDSFNCSRWFSCGH
jgi:hypothetical protein